MKIRKHWKKLLLTLTALFWASCSSDSDSNVSVTNSLDNGTTPDASIDTGFTGAAEVLYGVPSDTIIDTIYVEDSIYTESSSGTVQSSSSEAAQSSSSKEVYPGFGTFKMASDTSITCEVTEVSISGVDNHIKSPDEIMDLLETNTTRSIEELELLEDELEDSINYGVLYGSPSGTSGYIVKPQEFDCSNDSTYTTKTHASLNNYLYTIEEYKEKFPNQEPDKPQPLCQKTDFVRCDGATILESESGKTRFVGSLFKNYDSDKEALIDSVKAANGENLSDAQKNCLDSNVTSLGTSKDQYGTYFRRTGPLATTQICDGDTTVNPRYQAKLDSNRARIQEQIDNCLKEPE